MRETEIFFIREVLFYYLPLGRCSEPLPGTAELLISEAPKVVLQVITGTFSLARNTLNRENPISSLRNFFASKAQKGVLQYNSWIYSPPWLLLYRGKLFHSLRHLIVKIYYDLWKVKTFRRKPLLIRH
jgi:hypothetical protein